MESEVSSPRQNRDLGSRKRTSIPEIQYHAVKRVYMEPLNGALVKSAISKRDEIAS